MASTLNAILHGENSTTQAIWHPNPTVRGTWNIYQTCVVVCYIIFIPPSLSYVYLRFQTHLSVQVKTIFLCVWQAVHLNIPPPGEPPYKQILRRIGWSILAIIAPEVVALNAWLQYRDAKLVISWVNTIRGLSSKQPPQSRREKLLGCLRYLMDGLGMLCISPVIVVDRLRMLLRHSNDSHAFESEQRRLQINDLMARLEQDQLPWTIDTAFYALSGGGVMLIDHHIETLGHWRDFLILAQEDPKSLLSLQRAVLQDPSKASGLAKFITCAQAFWFCSQCIARLCQNMAISLLELNTFVHCVSAFFIYVFWWHKPYDASTHVYIEANKLFANHECPRSRNMSKYMFSSIDWALAGYSRPLVMILTFLLYGAIHSLAWRYHFPTNAEQIMWRCASVATALSGLIILVTALRGSELVYIFRRYRVKQMLHLAVYLLGFVAIAARSFLVVESFRALPNSPASIYEVPRWTAYIPHI